MKQETPVDATDAINWKEMTVSLGKIVANLRPGSRGGKRTEFATMRRGGGWEFFYQREKDGLAEPIPVQDRL